MTYNYVITQVKKDSTTNEEWVEELPNTNASDFYVKVAIPSDYMVLIQRDAANFEMFKMLGQASNPRKNQRCSYTGIGATPYNSGPGKAALSFDNGNQIKSIGLILKNSFQDKALGAIKSILSGFVARRVPE